MEDTKKYIVITDTVCETGRLLSENYKKNGFTVISLSGNNEEKEDEHFLNWNTSSPLSSTRIVREILNIAGKKIEKFIFIHTPSGISRNFSELQMTEIEELIDSSVKGYTALTKELLNNQSPLETTINFVFNKEQIEILSPVDSIIYGCIKSVADTVITHYRNSDNPPCGYENTARETSEFVDFILSKSEKKQKGRWNNYSKITKLFSSSKNRQQEGVK